MELINTTRTLVTSALPYANGHIHLGHAAGAYLPADIYVRYKRLKGDEVLFVCGSDEHGVAITIAADKENVTPQEIIDKYHKANKEAFEKFGISFDIYSRTSLPLHHETAREFFGDFVKKGYLIDLEEEQFFDAEAQMFLPDRYVEGICPNCGNDKARGDQCDSCGAYYEQIELKEPKSLISGKPPMVRKTSHWYMRFDMFQQFLENYIESHSHDWKENVLQQTRSWLKQGLTHRAITRDLNWGVKIDNIEGVRPEKSKGKAIYVWFDAVLGYISATKALMLEKPDKANDEWKKWWCEKSTRYIAFIGKDNIVFHTLIFPAMLHARGNGYILPDNVPANEFLNLEGKKFSKSRNWSIDLIDFIKEYEGDPSAIDNMRYTLAMNFPESRDSDFTWSDYQSRNNNELAAIFGNFINRTLQFSSKNWDGCTPPLEDENKWIDMFWKNLIEYFIYRGVDDENIINEIPEELKRLFGPNDFALIYSLWLGVNKISKNYEKFRFRDAITETMNIARAANKYFNDEEPWKKIKSDPQYAAKTIHICIQMVHSLAILFAPITPNASNRVFKMLGNKSITGDAQYGDKSEDFWKLATLPGVKGGVKINDPEILFGRIEDDLVKTQQDKLGKAPSKNDIVVDDNSSENLTNIISIEDVAKVELTTGLVILAENVPKSKKLIKMIVDIGTEHRQILAGIAEYYKPEDVLGKTVVVVANLKPAILMGIESQGMMLAASNSDGKLTLLTIEDKSIGIGANIK